MPEGNHACPGSVHKRLVRFVRGDHNSILTWNRAEYFAEIEAFVKELPS